MVEQAGSYFVLGNVFIYTHVYIWEEERNVNTEGLFGAGRK